MSRFVQSATSGARAALRLLAEAAGYLWRWAAELVAAGRAALLRRARRRGPAPGGDPAIEEKLARLRAAHDTRWTAWRAVAPPRRLAVRAVALLLLAGGVFVGRQLLFTPTPRPRPLARRVDRSDSRRRSTPRASSSTPTNLIRPSDAEQRPEDVAAAFQHDAAAARPGQWLKAGGRRFFAAVAPGPLGSWDDFKIGSPVVLAARDGSYRMWYRGCHFTGADYGCAVGHATSKDGIVWSTAPGPVLVPEGSFARAHLDTIAVAQGPHGYVLWYSIAPSWLDGHKQAELYAAHSTDGLAWTVEKQPAYTGVAPARRLMPAAAWDGTQFHLWFVDSRSPLDPATNRFPEMPRDGDDMLFHYVSPDGRQLTLAGSVPIQPLRIDPLPMSIAPVPSGGFRALLYEQHPIGASRQGVAVLRSADGTNWERRDDEAMPFGVSDLGSGVVPASMAATDTPDGLLAWFVARRTRGGESITVALRKQARR